MSFLGCFLPKSAASPLKVPLNIGAFVQNDVPDPSYVGRAVVKASGPDFYVVTGLYDANGMALTGNITNKFLAGGFQGSVDFKIIKPSGQGPDGRWFVDVACDANDIDDPSIGGGGTPCRIYVAAPPTVRHHWSVYQGNRKLAYGSFTEAPNMRLYLDGAMLYPSFTGGPGPGARSRVQAPRQARKK